MKNKSIYSAALLGVCLPCFTQSSVEKIQRNSALVGQGMLQAGDPNLDPNWNWAADVATGYTMYYSINGSTPLSVNSIQLPFYSAGDRLNLPGSLKDMYKEDGWSLVYKDFGTPTDAPPLPFFVLYNKYRSILRYMFYNAPSDEHTVYKAEARFRFGSSNVSATSPDRYSTNLFSFSSDPAKSYITNYNGQASQVQLSPMNTYRGWACFDIVASGFDPAMATSSKYDPALILTITPVDVSKMTVIGNGTMSLNQVVKSEMPTASNSTGNLQQAFNAISTGYSNYESADKALNKITAFANSHESGPGWVGTAAAIAATIASNGTLAPYAAGLAGAINAFIGGANKGGSQAVPLNFMGKFQFNLSGNIEAQNASSWSGLYYLNPGPQMSDGYRPVQPISWGVMSIDKQPEARLDIVHHTYWMMGWDNYQFIDHYASEGTVTITESPTVVINPDCGMRLVSEEAILDWGGTFPPIRIDYNDKPSTTSHVFPRADSCINDWSESWAMGAVPTGLTYVFKFRVNNPGVINSDTEFVYTKSYSLGTTTTISSVDDNLR
jgi:hypothetical protein